MKLFLLLTLCSVIALSRAQFGPIVIKEGDNSAIIIGQDGQGVPIVIDEKRTFKSMFKSLFGKPV